MSKPRAPLLSAGADETVKYTTCYMCACRCGVAVTVRDGHVAHIEGDPDHPVNNGVLCAKGAAGVMQQVSPARLRKPLKRVGERGRCEFVEIEWDEALSIAAEWLGKIRAEDPRKLAFFTGRDQSQSLTGWWATQFGTPNFASHGGFCSVNMAAAGFYTIGGSFWEFGEPDWERAKYLLLFGVAEDHASNPMKRGLGALKSRGAKVVSVNPVRSGYSAIADEWIGIRPGTDGLFVLALVHELLKSRKVDLDYLSRYANAHWLVIDAPGAADHGLFARDDMGRPLCFDRKVGRFAEAGAKDADPALAGAFPLADGRRARPVFALVAERYLDSRYSCSGALQRAGRDHAPHRRGNRRRRLQSNDHDRDAVEGLLGAQARDLRRPARFHLRHARRFGAFERFPDLPRAASLATAPRRRRLPPAASASARRFRGRRRRRRSRRARPSRPTRLFPGRRSAIRRRPTTCSSMGRARLCASTRPIPGRRRSRPMG